MMLNMNLYGNKAERYKLRHALIGLSACILSCFSFLFIISTYINLNISELLKYGVVAVYLYTLLTSRIFFAWNHSFILFLLAFALFLLGRIFLDVFFGHSDIYLADKIAYYTLQPQVVSVVLFTFIISLLSLHIGGLLFAKRPVTGSMHLNLSNKAKYILLFLTIVLLPGTILKLYHDYREIVSAGYLSAFSSERVAAPLPFRLSWFILKSIAPLFIVFIRNRKHLLLFVLLMLIIDISNVLSGNRSTLIAPLAYFFWYFYKFLAAKAVKVTRLVVIGVGIIVFSIVAINLREKVEVTKFDLVKYSEAFFYSQGVSYLVNAYYYDYEDQLLNPSPFAMFHPVYNYFLRWSVSIGHSEEYVKETISLDHKLTYAVSSNAYLNGQGLGSSYLIELEALGGYLMIVLGSFLLGVIIIKLEHYFAVNVNLRYLSWFWIYHLISLPRAGVLPDLFPILLCVLAFNVLKLISTSRSKEEASGSLQVQ